jgi:hypothetical protein
MPKLMRKRRTLTTSPLAWQMTAEPAAPPVIPVIAEPWYAAQDLATTISDRPSPLEIHGLLLAMSFLRPTGRVTEIDVEFK